MDDTPDLKAAFRAGFEASREGMNGEVAVHGDVDEFIDDKFRQYRCDHDWTEWRHRDGDGLRSRVCKNCGEQELTPVRTPK